MNENGVVHHDMLSINVMCVKYSTPRRIKYPNFHMYSTYVPVIVDFGKSSITFSSRYPLIVNNMWHNNPHLCAPMSDFFSFLISVWMLEVADDISAMFLLYFFNSVNDLVKLRKENRRLSVPDVFLPRSVNKTSYDKYWNLVKNDPLVIDALRETFPFVEYKIPDI